MEERTRLDLTVQYGFVFFQATDAEPVEDIIAARGGQINGICGAAFPGVLAMVTGLHTGSVPFEVCIADAAPVLTNGWEDVVEVSLNAVSTDYMLTTFDDSASVHLPAATTYRARFCASGMDAANGQDTRLDDEASTDEYLLSLWPAPPIAEEIQREHSDIAKYWHRVARDTPAPPPPPTPDQLAEVEARRAAWEAQERSSQLAAAELRRWGGTEPTEKLRAVGPVAHGLAAMHREFAEQLAILDEQLLRRIACWLAHEACDRAGPGRLDWGPALFALDDGAPLPPPFDDPRTAWTTLYPGPRRYSTSISMIGDKSRSRQPIAAPAAALATVIAAADARPVTAAFRALSQATAGVEEPQLLIDHLRRTFDLPPRS